MSDFEGAQEPVEATGAAETQAVEPAQQEQHSSSGHPAWGELEKQLGPTAFALARPHLESFDKSANDRITSLNGQIAPFKSFIDQKVDPAQLQQAYQIAQAIESNPMAMYERLKEYLESQGMLEAQASAVAAQQVQQAGEEPEFDPNDISQNPMFQQLQASQQQLADYIQQQQQAQITAQAEQEVGASIEAFKQAHPEIANDPVTMKMILQQAAAQAQLSKPGQALPSLEDVAAPFLGMRDRILSAPRPGAAAPQLAPTSGGVPPAQQQIDVAKLGANDRQALLAGLMDVANNGSSA